MYQHPVSLVSSSKNSLCHFTDGTLQWKMPASILPHQIPTYQTRTGYQMSSPSSPTRYGTHRDRENLLPPCQYFVGSRWKNPLRVRRRVTSCTGGQIGTSSQVMSCPFLATNNREVYTAQHHWTSTAFFAHPRVYNAIMPAHKVNIPLVTAKLLLLLLVMVALSTPSMVQPRTRIRILRRNNPNPYIATNTLRPLGLSLRHLGTREITMTEIIQRHSSPRNITRSRSHFARTVERGAISTLPRS